MLQVSPGYDDEDADYDSNYILEHYYNISYSSVLLNDSNKYENSQSNRIKSMFVDTVEEYQGLQYKRMVIHEILDNLISLQPSLCHEPCVGTATAIDTKVIRFDDLLFKKIDGINLFAYDKTLKQLRKDLFRDQLLLNGNYFVGSKLSLEDLWKVCDNIVKKLSTTTELTIDLSPHSSLPSVYDYSHFYTKCFIRSSRTHSGSVAFQVLRNEFDVETFTIVPLSSLAPPIRLNFSIAPEWESSTLKTVLHCEIISSTVFRVLHNMNQSVVFEGKSYPDEVILSVNYVENLSSDDATPKDIDFSYKLSDIHIEICLVK